MHPTESDDLRVTTPFTPSRPSSVHVTTTTTHDEGYFPCASATVSVPDDTEEGQKDGEGQEEIARLSPMRPAVVRVTTRRNTVVEKSEANVPEHVAWEERRIQDGEKWDHEV